MPDSHDRSEKPDNDNANAQEKMRGALERSVAEIKTPAQARHTLDSLEKTAGDLREDDVATAREEAGEVPVAAPAAGVIASAAAQSAHAAPDEKSIVDESVTQAFGGGAESDGVAADTRRGRRHLRDELFKRLGPLQVVDSFVFSQTTPLPNWNLSDGFVTRLSGVMTGGTGCLLFLLLATLVDRQG